MAASGFMGSSARRPDVSGTDAGFSGGFPPPPGSDGASAASASAGNEAQTDDGDVEFGSFSAAERTSDPYADVYGVTTDFNDAAQAFANASSASVASGIAMGSPLLSFSPLAPPTSTTPTLLSALSSESDPFADITGGMGAIAGATDVLAQSSGAVTTSVGGNTDPPTVAAPPTSSSSTSAILDLVWGNSSNLEATSAMIVQPPLSSSSTGSGNRAASLSSRFLAPPLPPPPSPKASSFPSFPSAGADAVSTGELLSFSPVRASTSATNDPFFGLSNDTGASSNAGLVFGGDDLFSLTATPPLSTSSSSAPTSLHGSFASLHEAIKPPSTAEAAVEAASPRDPFAERTTRSFGSLSSSFLSVRAVEDTVGKAAHALSPAAAPTIASSPSSAPASLRGSFKMGQGFMGFSSAADDSDIVDPFEEAGLSFEQMPLAEALAAWDTSTELVEETKQEVGEEGATDGVEGEEKEAKQVIDAQRDGLLLTSENGDGTPEVSRPTDATIMDALDATHDADDDVAVTSEYEDVELLENPLTIERRTMELPAPDSLTATEEPSPAEYTQFSFISDQTKSEPKSQALFPKDTDVHSLGLQDAAFESDESGSGEGSVRSASENEIAWPEEQEAVEEEASPFERNHSGFMSFSSPAMADENRRVEGAGQTLVSEDETSLDREASGNGGSEVVKEESNGPSEEDQAADSDEDEGFGDFGGFEAVASSTSSASAPTGFGLDSEPRAPQPETFDAFGDFAVAAPTTLASGVVVKAVEDDDFGDFAQSSSTADAMGDDDFGGFAQSTDVNDDFGDFAQSSSTQDEGGFSDFQQSSSSAFDNDDDGFGDFTPSVPVAPVPPMVPAASKEDLSAFFHQAFTTDPVPPSPPSLTMDSIDYKASDVVQEPSTPFVQDVFRSTWDEYLSLVSTTSGRASSSSSASVSSPVAQDPNDSSERTLECRKTARASKYLKYVLSEKIQEASRQNGIFPHGSDRHQTYVELAASGDAERMRAALKELQDALFLNSVNDAMMRIAKQAALSAKAKIAEQAAQQQASSRGGSLFSTTRHLLSRGGGTGGGGHGPGSSGNESKGEHTGADTPTGASVQKLSRFSFAGHDDSGNGHHGPSGGEEIGSEGSDHTGHSSGSDTDVLAGSGAGDSRTRSSSLTNSGGASGNGGLMKKFQDRFSFASSRHRPRFVSLRRKGQSGEEVRKMELNLDAISGGLDEVKWKCAMFLYDVEEVAHVAPSQIRILAYPSKQLLAGKTDRSALVKLVKPGTIWTVDIGANNSDLLNEW